MNDSENWALALRTLSKLQGESPMRTVDKVPETVEQLTGNTVFCGGPTETFSSRMPAFSAVPEEEASAPIDVLYGRYDPTHLQIEIFIERIRLDYRLFGCELIDLLTVVRMHEYAHSLVHSGIDVRDIQAQFGNFNSEGTTDWKSFKTNRDQAFSTIDDSAHELLAQAITWACLCQDTDSQSLAETFLALEARQPRMYRLPPHVKLRAYSADWPLILKAARGEIDAYRGPGFSLADGLVALIEETAKQREFIEATQNDPLQAALRQLQQRLAAVDLATLTPSPKENEPELLVLRKRHVELRMYKEVGHHRPHFHIEYKNEFSASYALDSFDRLAGYMPKKYEDQILPLARQSREQLIARWESLNGTFRITLGEDEQPAT